MFEIGFWELVLVGVVALLVVGPEKLPGLARTAGLWLGRARRMIAEVKADVDRELHLEELKQSLRQQADVSEIKDLADRVRSLRRDVEEEFDDPGPPPGWTPGMHNAPPPPGWTPPAAPAEASAVTLRKPAVPETSVVTLQKPAATAADVPAPPPSPPAAS